MKKYLLIDTNVITRLKQGTAEEKNWIKKLAISKLYLVFYGEWSYKELTNYGETEQGEENVDINEQERNQFHYVNDNTSIELLRPIKNNEDEWARRASIITKQLLPAFKKKWPNDKFTPSLKDYRTIKKEDFGFNNWKDFVLFKPLEYFRFNFFLTFDSPLFQFYKENKKIFEKLECEILTLNKKQPEYSDALKVLRL